MRVFLFILTVLLYFSTLQSYSQLPFSAAGYSADELLEKARKAAHSGENELSREIAFYILEKHPGYLDARVLAGTTLSWDGLYDSARVLLTDVLDSHHAHFDALNAVINLEIWDGNYEEAVRYCNTGLDYHYETELFSLKKARALRLAGQLPLAILAIEQLLEIYPDNQNAQHVLVWYRMLLSQSLSELFFDAFHGLSYHPELHMKRSYILAEYHGDYFDRSYKRRWHMGSVGYSRNTSFGPVTGKINFAQTYFDGRGLTRYPVLQYELESYPVLSPQYYAFVNYAYSRGASFPDHRGALELYRKLPRAFEASLGVRYMRWNESFFFYTGSLGKYYGNYLFSLRPYIFPHDDGVSQSYHLNIRRYWETADDFAGISLGTGIIPVETYMVMDRKIYLSSWTAGMDMSKIFMDDYLFRAGVRFAYEEHAADSFRNRVMVYSIFRYYLGE